MVSAVIVLITVYLMITAVNAKIEEKNEIKNLNYLKLKALYYADSLIKNSNSKEPEKGIAFYNKEKKRTEENIIDLKLAEKLNEKNFPEKLKEIRIETKKVKIKTGEKKGNCFEVRRFILTEQKEKGIIYVSTCN